MDSLGLMKNLSQVSAGKILLMVLDGLGGLPHPETGKTELETARTPNLDGLAAKQRRPGLRRGLCRTCPPDLPRY